MDYDDPGEHWSEERLDRALTKRSATNEAAAAAIGRGKAEKIQTLRDIFEQESRLGPVDE